MAEDRRLARLSSRRSFAAPAAAPAATLAAVLAAALVASCGGPRESAPARGATGATAGGRLTLERLLAADREPHNWYTGGRDLGATHHSPLRQIDASNVARLGFAWEYATGTTRGLQATPIVIDGVLYTSGVAGRVYALDAASGRPLWTFEPTLDMQVNRYACCDAVNRGVAVWNGRVYVAALDGRLYALDAASGAVRWSVDTIVDRTRAYASTGAPAIAGRVVVIGNGGAEFDARGYVSAYDLESGELRWRFYTVPGDPSKAHEHPELAAAAKTWDPKSRWDLGLGGTVWDALIYDPDSNLLYVGTGNGTPHSQAARSPSGGDNLYLASILALNPDTGRLVWHVQQAPGDSWDYTATQPMILAEFDWQGRRRSVLMQAPKNGFFYVIDRRTGEVLSAKPYVPVTWATHVESGSGRVHVNRAIADYRNGARLFFPSGQGGHNWNPMAYSAETGLVYIPAVEIGELRWNPPGELVRAPRSRNMWARSVFSGEIEAALPTLPPEIQRAVRSGKLFEGQPDRRMRAVLKAWDPRNARVVWEVESLGGSWDRAGVLSTSGGLVFQGTGTGLLRVFDARRGTLLATIDIGTTIVAAPMTYAVDGVQYVAVMAGWGGASWPWYRETSAAARNGNAGRILAFKLDGGPTPRPKPLPPLAPIPEPPRPQPQDATLIERGNALFTAHCRSCHGNFDRTGSADLRRSSAGTHAMFEQILLGGALLPRGMPRFDDVLDRNDVAALQAWVLDNAWQAHRRGAQAAAAARTTH